MEPVEIYGGHLDGMRLCVVFGRDRFYLGKVSLRDGPGEVWGPGNDAAQLFYRTARRTAAGKIVFVPVEPQVTA